MYKYICIYTYIYISVHKQLIWTNLDTEQHLRSATQHCNILQYTATHCNTDINQHGKRTVLIRFAVLIIFFNMFYSGLSFCYSKYFADRYGPGCYSLLQCVAVICSVLQCVAVCCSVMQCVAVCCCVLLCVAVCCSVLLCVAVCCSVLQFVVRLADRSCLGVLQCVAVCCSVLLYNLSLMFKISTFTYAKNLPLKSPSSHCNILQHDTATHRNTLQHRYQSIWTRTICRWSRPHHTAIYCNTTLQHTATHCNTDINQYGLGRFAVGVALSLFDERSDAQ